MARGSKYSDRDREQALAMLASGMSVCKVAETMRIPKQTISDWNKRAETGDGDYIEARAAAKRKLVKSMWDIVDKGTLAVERQVSAALREKRDIDKVIDTIVRDGNIDAPTTKMIVKIVREHTGLGAGELCRIVSTYYDRADALENRENEQQDNVVEVRFGEQLALKEMAE